ncbi:MAG TPA: Gfo/Idh/MocA family oxidoreductase [Limnochordia bacterium]
MAQRRWRVGTVGLRGIVKYHTRAFLDDGRAEIVACCDIQPDVLAQYAAEFNVPRAYRDFETMLAQERLDIVVIATAELLHAPMTIQAAAHRPKAILCEKPMAMNLAEADAMLAACEENGVCLIIGHQRRYKPQYARAKELLASGAIGRLESIQASGHRGTSLMVDGTHTVDLIRFFADDAAVEWVIGQVDIRRAEIGHWRHANEDASLALFKFTNGVRAFLTTGGEPGTGDREALGAATNGIDEQAAFHYHRILLHGSHGVIDIRGDRPAGGQPLLSIRRGGEIEGIPVDHHGWHHGRSPQSELIDVLEQGGTHPLDGRSARATLEILMAIFESARLGGIVSLPLNNPANPLEQMLTAQGRPFLATG